MSPFKISPKYLDWYEISIKNLTPPPNPPESRSELLLVTQFATKKRFILSNIFATKILLALYCIKIKLLFEHALPQ